MQDGCLSSLTLSSLAYFSGEFEWLIPSGDSCAVVVAKPTEFNVASPIKAEFSFPPSYANCACENENTYKLMLRERLSEGKRVATAK